MVQKTSPGQQHDRSVLVEVLTKQGCHLCEEAVAVTVEVCAEFGVQPVEVDLTEDPETLARHAEEIPVLRIDGQVRDFWRVDPVRLRRLLGEALKA
ncbi:MULTISPECIES: glutaredoxin family protein [Nesterenkonia]|uniref:Glutaredoxin n=1 Tax=Nesterenkonia xinjiangensis TaxID=225327 RepID=A0A7Z0GKZ1_9MICC|nr:MULTISPECIES: glutaredoxin family protein [Nesterenkonia]MDZ5077033.1 glutaredoxin family protein [Nesterenkonia sp. HG001]NYJ77663.1 glutaredoxin [Nesterenkonia xinjiangensis]